MKITQVDAFADHPFAGNPAAVCVLERAADEGWMQNVACEMNLSETSFLYPEPMPDGSPAYRLRWFTPTVEVDLCGHATLAAAHVLWEDGWLAVNTPACFFTRSGRLNATRDLDGWIELDFPSDPVHEIEPPADLAVGLGGERFRYVGRNRMDLLVELESEEDVRAIRPDFARLAAIETRGIIATALADSSPELDFVSRFFAPRVGVPEDPVTGSAHCALTPFWAARLGKSSLTARQVSERGGKLRLNLRGSRIGISGQAVTVLQGELLGSARPVFES